jgi:hypothetical protein
LLSFDVELGSFLRGAGDSTTQGSEDSAGRWAPAKIPISPELAPAADGLGSTVVTFVDPGVLKVGCDLTVLVTALPTPVPENSTLTVVVDAPRAGPIFGANFCGLDKLGPEPCDMDTRSAELPLSDLTTVEGKKSFDIGAIHAFAPLCTPFSLVFCPSAKPGFKASSLNLTAEDGSRMTPFIATLNWPSSLKASLMSLKKRRRSFLVQAVTIFSSSNKKRK